MTATSSQAIATMSTPSPPAEPGLGHKRLEAFLGRWHTDGQQYESPFGPAATFKAVERWEWLPGGFFLIHRLEGHIGDQPVACIEITGHDPADQTYCAYTYYNDGTSRTWRMRERDGTWTLTAEGQTGDKLPHARWTAVFSDGGNVMTGTWEYSSDDSTWKPFMEARSTKAE